MDSLICMRAFVRVVEHGSFARAAESLDLSRPAVTTAIAQLEKRLGVRLLHRTTRRLSQTAEGRAYYDDCVRILGDVAEAEEALRTTRVSARGRLRVSVPHAFIHQGFVRALPEFMRRHRELTVEVALTDRAVNLVEEGFDCAVRGVALPDDSTLVARRICRGWRLTCASPEYLRKHGTPRSVDDLAAHECIAFVSPTTRRVQEWTFRRGEESRSFVPNGRVRMTSVEAAAHAAAAGLGITQGSDAVVLPEIRAGRLRVILADQVTEAAPLCLVYPANRYVTAKIRAFGDFIASLFPSEGAWPEYAKTRMSRGTRRSRPAAPRPTVVRQG